MKPGNMQSEVRVNQEIPNAVVELSSGMVPPVSRGFDQKKSYKHCFIRWTAHGFVEPGS